MTATGAWATKLSLSPASTEFSRVNPRPCASAKALSGGFTEEELPRLDQPLSLEEKKRYAEAVHIGTQNLLAIGDGFPEESVPRVGHPLVDPELKRLYAERLARHGERCHAGKGLPPRNVVHACSCGTSYKTMATASGVGHWLPGHRNTRCEGGRAQ